MKNLLGKLDVARFKLYKWHTEHYYASPKVRLRKVNNFINKNARRSPALAEYINKRRTPREDIELFNEHIVLQ